MNVSLCFVCLALSELPAFLVKEGGLNSGNDKLLFSLLLTLFFFLS